MSSAPAEEHTLTGEQILHYVDVIDRHEAFEGMKQIILETWRELRYFFDQGDIEPSDFREAQSVLWQKYEDSGEAGLPEAQRKRVKF